MLKRWLPVAVTGFVVMLWPACPKAQAAGDFTTAFDTTYMVGERGLTGVELHVRLTNNQASTFAQEYSLTFGSSRLKNLTAQTASGVHIPATLVTGDNRLTVTLKFPDPVVGKGKVQDFTVRYEDPDAAQKIGSVLEVMVPKLENAADPDSYAVHLMVPVEYGQPAIIAPSTYETRSDPVFTRLDFTGQATRQSGITAIFGDRQIYAFNLTYHLQNSTVTPLDTQIALPPDTPYQRLFYETIDPPPRLIHRDADGNWIADYSLESKNRLTVTAKGQVITYIKPTVPVAEPLDNLRQYLTPQKNWPVNDPAIRSLAQKYTTPEAIYRYLVETFKYDYNRLDNRSTARMGAKEALANPQSALCLEFTDAFVTLARAAGIPARLLTGFAYTENSRLRPLSLVQDVLHAWPEYYDFTARRWQPVDPTWGNTTGGLDYFHALDFNHIVFAIQGLYDDHPFPAGYYKVDQNRTKDVIVELNQTVPPSTPSLQTALTEPFLTKLYLGSQADLTVTNHSTFALYGYSLNIGGQNLTVDKPAGGQELELLPYQHLVIPVQFTPSSITGTAYLTVSAHDYTRSYPIERLSAGTLQAVTLAAAALAVGGAAAAGAYAARRLLVSRRQAKHPVHRQGQETPRPPA